MRIVAHENNWFSLEDEQSHTNGQLVYQGSGFRKGEVRTTKTMILEQVTTGIWKSFSSGKGTLKQEVEMKAIAGGVIILHFSSRKRYRLKRSGAWKTRFVLLNRNGDELLSLLPRINWEKKTYEFTLQLNDECKIECTPVLILHATHCAVCSLSMVNGGDVPPQVSV